MITTFSLFDRSSKFLLYFKTSFSTFHQLRYNSIGLSGCWCPFAWVDEQTWW